MTTIELEPLTEIQEKIIYKPFIEFKVVESVDVLRIQLSDDYTKIDFIVYASRFDWVQIQKDTFIRICGSEVKLNLIEAVNISIAPRKHFFRNRNEFLCYTLCFPAIPKDTKSIDVIERETEVRSGNFTWFNFYGLSLERIISERIKVGS